jgi:hypothetical protein
MIAHWHNWWEWYDDHKIESSWIIIVDTDYSYWKNWERNLNNPNETNIWNIWDNYSNMIIKTDWQVWLWITIN